MEDDGEHPKFFGILVFVTLVVVILPILVMLLVVMTSGNVGGD
jgi:hypothetical protein